MKSELQIFLGDQLVGVMTLLPGGQSLFVFADDYINDTHRPVLSQAFLLADGKLQERTRPVHARLPPWFSNLLPEGALREYIAKQADIHPDREFQLLSFLGEDLPGAVRAVAAGTKDKEVESQNSDTNQAEAPLRFSLAGVQLKFSALMNQHGGLTIPAGGMGGDWIVKLPSAIYPAVPENEAAMLTLASRVGITVPEHRLVPINSIQGMPNLGNFADQNALAVRRFDRLSGGKRVHMEDLAQVFGIFPRDKYEKVGCARIAELVGQVLGPQAAQDFIARLAFIILTGNGDMHLKNWSLLYPDGRTPTLAPAYDLVSTVAYIENERLALNIAGEKSFASITRDRFRRLAEKAALPERETLATVDRIVDAVQKEWPEVRRETNLPQSIAEKIDKHLRKLPLIISAKS
jgi:serine/threonine-protein kinase HipA